MRNSIWPSKGSRGGVGHSSSSALVADVTSDKDRISLCAKFAYSAGVAAVNAASAAFGVLLNPVFNITLGVNPAILSSILFVQRLWNVTIDPFAGYLSDCCKSPLGRRRAFVVATALPLGAAFATIWIFPATLTIDGLLIWLLVSSLLFYTVLSFYSVPLLALGVEMTADYHERTRLNVVSQLVSFILLISIQWAFPIMQSRLFSSVLIGGRVYAIVFGSIISVLAILPYIYCRESKRQLDGNKGVGMVVGIKSALKNRPFVHILGLRTIYSFSYNIVAILGLYLNYYYVYSGDIKKAAIMQGWNGTAFQISGILSLILFRRFALRYGKREAVLCGAALFALGCLMKLVVYSPHYPWLQLIVYVSNGMSAAAMTAPVDAMIPDIVDYGEIMDGSRREGLYVAVLAWCERAGNSMGTLLSGLILVGIGFNAKLGGMQSSYTLEIMKWSYAMVPFVGACSIFLIMQQYPLTVEQCYRIKSCIEKRCDAL